MLWNRVETRLLVAAVVASSVITSLLGWQVRDLRGKLSQTELRLIGAQPGTFVAEIEAQSTAGGTLRLGSPPVGHKEVLIVYNTSCEHCISSLAAWRTLAIAVADRHSVRILGVSTDDLERTTQYAASHQLPFESIVLSDQRLISLHRFTAVPQLLIIEHGGRIAHSWLGGISEPARLDSILAAIQIDP